MIVAAAVFAGLCANLFGTRSAIERVRLAKERQSILNVAPVGTPITAAKERLATRGYDCVYQVDQTWGERTHLDYFYCNRFESAGWPVRRRWQVALINQNQKVAEVFISTGLVGP